MVVQTAFDGDVQKPPCFGDGVMVIDFLFGNEIDAPTQAADCLRRMTTAQQEQALALLKAIAG